MNALITTLNEESNIGSLVAAVSRFVDDVVVVDDPRTTDRTAAVAADAGALVIGAQDEDMVGIGPCLLAGMRYLEGTRIVVIDAGGSHSASAIPSMRRIHADVVIGSRFVPGARYIGSVARRRASMVYSRMCNAITGQRILDWTSGFRIYSERAVSAVLDACPPARMHAFQAQALAAALRSGCSTREHPITYRAGRSSMSRPVAWEATRALVDLRAAGWK